MQFRDDNGLFCVTGHRHAAYLAYLGLHALQHRGRAGCGIAVLDGDVVRVQRGEGPVEEQFDSAALDALRGRVALGQVYGHTPSGQPAGVRIGGDLRPTVGRYKGGALAVALAGRLTNGASLRSGLQERGRLFQGPTDAELVAQLVAESQKGTFVNRLVDALWQVKGAYALIVVTEDRVVAVRDPMGFRPLVLGRVDDAHALASDDAPLRFVGGEVVREIEAGEMVILEPRGITSVRPFPKREPAQCVLEAGQLTAPTAFAFGMPAHAIRVALGERLGREAPAPNADVVFGIPGQDDAAALGYAKVVDKPFRRGLVDGGLVARELVSPPREVGGLGARIAASAVPAVVAGKHVALVAASVGSGETVRRAVRLLRDAGVGDVHLRVAQPPEVQACRYGVASPVSEQLLVPRYGSVDAAATALGVRSVAFLSLEGLRAVVGERKDGERLWCDACLTGTYPLPPEAPDDQLDLFTADG